MRRMIRFVFKLSMPNVGSWNGRWSGEERNYIVVKTMSDDWKIKLGVSEAKGNSWYYRWDDGWGASVSCRIAPKNERLPKSDGFCGYEWMIQSIMDYDKIMNDGEAKEWEQKQEAARVEHSDSIKEEALCRG